MIIKLYFCNTIIETATNNKLKIKIMKASEITKTLNKVNAQPNKYSLGFRRLTSLPIRVRKNINLSCILKGESDDNSMKEFLNTLTEQQFINWLIQA